MVEYRASEGLWVLERRPRLQRRAPEWGSPRRPPSRLVLQVAKAALGQFGECLGSCLGCQGAGHGVGLMWGDRWGFGGSRQNSTSWGRAKSKAGAPQRREHKRQGQQGQGQGQGRGGAGGGLPGRDGSPTAGRAGAPASKALPVRRSPAPTSQAPKAVSKATGWEATAPLPHAWTEEGRGPAPCEVCLDKEPGRRRRAGGGGGLPLWDGVRLGGTARAAGKRVALFPRLDSFRRAEAAAAQGPDTRALGPEDPQAPQAAIRSETPRPWRRAAGLPGGCRCLPALSCRITRLQAPRGAFLGSVHQYFSVRAVSSDCVITQFGIYV
ncbi:translation initiation factor IF-2-like [Mustela putorius furo]|uniref:Translation initiation factor IF-2-like n=1 Tax=Mustela putorius furo TaxID=9669 RepID=A0A8U0NYU3_MUSPF|nr:translation initiation factor IF-2-like [Mustela putorius furo]